MTREQIRSFLERYVRAQEQRDIDALLTCYAQNAEVVSPLFRTAKGEAAIEAQFQDAFRAFSDVSIQIDDVVVDTDRGERAVLVLTMTFTHRGDILGFPASGRRVQTPMAFVFRFEGDRIVSERRLYDFTGLLVKLGVLRAKGA